MRTTRHQSRGTTNVPVAVDVMRPTDALGGPRTPLYAPSRWFRPFLVLAATAAALALLIGAVL